MTTAPPAGHPMTRVLAAGIPLTLLIDLFASTRPPDSPAIYRTEPAGRDRFAGNSTPAA